METESYLSQPDQPNEYVSDTDGILENYPGPFSRAARPILQSSEDSSVLDTITEEHKYYVYIVPQPSALEEEPSDFPLDTCIQTTDIALEAGQVLNFSPVEGKTPVSLMMDKG